MRLRRRVEQQVLQLLNDPRVLGAAQVEQHRALRDRATRSCFGEPAQRLDEHRRDLLSGKRIQELVRRQEIVEIEGGRLDPVTRPVADRTTRAGHGSANPTRRGLATPVDDRGSRRSPAGRRPAAAGVPTLPGRRPSPARRSARGSSRRPSAPAHPGPPTAGPGRSRRSWSPTAVRRGRRRGPARPWRRAGPGGRAGPAVGHRAQIGALSQPSLQLGELGCLVGCLQVRRTQSQRADEKVVDPALRRDQVMRRDGLEQRRSGRAPVRRPRAARGPRTPSSAARPRSARSSAETGPSGDVAPRAEAISTACWNCWRVTSSAPGPLWTCTATCCPAMNCRKASRRSATNAACWGSSGLTSPRLASMVWRVPSTITAPWAARLTAASNWTPQHRVRPGLGRRRRALPTRNATLIGPYVCSVTGRPRWLARTSPTTR